MTASQPSANRLLVIGWDAADWKIIHPLVDAGLMPTLARLIEQGCIANLATLRPCLSPMLWTSIATGKRADKHGVCGFVEPLPDASGVRLVGSTSRKTKAFWNITSQAGLRTHVIGWYASHPAEPVNGVCVSDQFLDPSGDVSSEPPAESIHPTDLKSRLANLRVNLTEIGAGDMLPFIPTLAEIDTAGDARPAKLAAALAACASIHAVATDVLANQPWDVAAVYYDALDRVGHEFMPFHPPKLPQVSDVDFRHYQHVITGMYRFHDMMLDTLLQIAGENVTVMLLSDHGFHSDHLRPNVPAHTTDAQAALWHRHFGILAMKGANIRADERVYGATLLDITPTILSLLNLPVGADMEGTPLVSAMENPPKIESIPSWDAAGGEGFMHPPDMRIDAAASAAAVQQLIDLGYLAPQSGDGSELAAIAARETQFNLAAVHTHARRPGAALPILQAIHNAHPAEPRYAMALAHCHSELQQHREALEVLRAVESRGLGTPDLQIALAQSELALDERDSAITRLKQVEQSAPPSPHLYLVLGNLYRAQKMQSQAEAAYRRAIALDDENEQAHYGLAITLIPTTKWDQVAEHALRAVGLVHAFPQAHYVLGSALDEMGQTDRALTSLRMAVSLAPNFPEAHERIAAILLRQGHVAESMMHRQMAQGDFRANPATPR